MPGIWDSPPTKEELEGADAAPGAEQVPTPQGLMGKVQASFAKDFDSNEKLSAIFSNSLNAPVERQAGVIRLAKDTGLDVDFVNDYYDGFSRAARESNFDPERFRQDFPTISRMILERPETGTIVVQDSVFQKAAKALAAFNDWTAQHPLSTMAGGNLARASNVLTGNERLEPTTPYEAPKSDGPRTVNGESKPDASLLDVATGSYAREHAGVEASKLGFDALLAFDDSDFEREKKILNLQRESQRYVDYGDGVLRSMVQDASGLLASEAETIKGSVEGAAVAGVGAALTLAATRNPQAAKEVGKGIIKFALPAGAAIASFRLESGGAYLDFRDAKLDDGTPMDPFAARGAALAYGAVASAIELLGDKVAVKMFGPLGDAIAKRDGRAFVKGLLRNPSARQLLSDSMKRWAEGAAGEGLEEFSQQLAQGLSEWAGKSIQAGSVQNFDAEKNLAESLQAGGTAFSGSLLIGAGGAGVNLVTHAVSQAKNEKANASVPVINEIADSSTAKADPELTAKYIAEETAKAGDAVTSMYVDPGAIGRLFQDGSIKPQDVLGEDGDRKLQEALATGSKLEIPMRDYLARFTPEMRNAIAKDITTKAAHLTANESKRLDKEVEEQAKEIAKAFESDNPPEVETDAEARFVETIQKQLAETGTYSEKQAADAVKLNRQFIRTQAARFGVSADDLFGLYTETVSSEQSQPVQAAAQTQEARLEQGPSYSPIAALKDVYGKMTDEQRLETFYKDPTTGLLNRRAWDRLQPTAEKPMVARIAVEGTKWLNDKGRGHAHADGLLRMVGRALGAVAPESAKVGGDFAVYVKDQAELDAILEQVRQAVPDKRFSVYGAVGQDFASAGQATNALADGLRAEGKMSDRGARPMGVGRFRRAKGIQFGDQTAEWVKVNDGLRQAFAEANKSEAAFNEAFVERGTGLLTQDGWNNLPRKKFRASIDLNGLKAANEQFTPEGGNAVLSAFGGLLANNGGARFDAAHLHGDEYAAQFDSKEELADFLATVRKEAQTIRTAIALPDGRIGVLDGLAFAYGVAKTEEAAERGLNKDKKRLTKTGERGAQADAKHFRVFKSVEEGRSSFPDLPWADGVSEGRRPGENPGADAASPGAKRLFQEIASPLLPGERLEQPAYHGTPHRGIEKFSLSKMGTGEGVQAYGWGLYFAQNKQIAEWYRRKLAGDGGLPKAIMTLGGAPLPIPKNQSERLDTPEQGAARVIRNVVTALQGHNYHNPKSQVAITGERVLSDAIEGQQAFVDDLRSDGDEAEAQRAEKVVEALKAIRPADLEIKIEEPGQLYKVDVPEDDQLLDFGKKLADQPPGVLEKILNAWPKLKNEYKSDLPYGSEFYEQISEQLGSDKAASEALNAAGIPGLRFLDGISRSSGEGNHNYVIWNEEAIKLLETFYQNAAAADGPRGWMDQARDGLKRIFKVVLTDKADLSTFLHESGHVYLEILGDLAERADAPEAAKADWAKTLEWLGAADRKSITREMHEQWARGFEAYLFEGKAPSPDLIRPFRRFSNWLKRIYKTLVSLNVPMNDDIRGVFDRMLATDAEIERVKGDMGLKPMFRSPDEAGMNPEQWKAYLEEQEAATSTATTRVERAILKDRLRQMDASWKEEMKNEVEAAKAKYDLLPAARAARFMHNGDIVDDTGKVIAIATVDAPLDEVAELFNFSTGQEMQKAIAELLPRDEWAKQFAEIVMNQKHGDLLHERERLRRLVANDLHSVDSARLLYREYEMISRQAGPAVQFNWVQVNGEWMQQGSNSRPVGLGGMVPIDSIRRAAELIAQGKRMNELSFGRMLQAERKASERAFKAVTQKNWAQALVYKQQQLLNHFLYTELSKAADERDALVAMAKKLRKDTARARAGKASPALRDGIDSILESVGLKSPGQRDTPMASLNETVEAMTAGGTTVMFDEGLIGSIIAQPREFKNLTVTEMREVAGALKNIKAAATSRLTALVDGKREDREAIVASLVADAEANLPDKGPPSSSIGAESMVDAGLGVFSGFDGSMLRQETMAGWLGGKSQDSMWFRAIILPIQKAKQYEADLLKQTIAPIVEAMEAIPDAIKKHLQDKVDGQALFPTHTDKIQAPSRRFELLMMALNMGNESNKKRLLEGRSISEKDVMGALDVLTKEEWDWVVSVWRAADSLWPLARDLEERDSGLAPAKIKSSPVQTKFGLLEGGYFPAVYDRRAEIVGEKQAAQTVADLMDPSFTRPGTSHSHLKKRVDNFSGIIALDPSAITSHFAQVAHDIAAREAVKSVGGLIMDPAVQQALKRRLGDKRAVTFLQWVKDFGQMRGAQVNTHAKDLNRFMRQLKSNASTATLGYAANVAFGDAANLAVAATQLKKKHWAAGLAEFVRSPFESREMALQKSGELRFREDELTRSLQKQVSKLTQRNPLRKGVPGWFIDHAFTFMEWSDKLTATPIWLGAYRQGLAEGMAESRAIEFADSMLRKLFPSHSPADQAEVLRDKGFIGASLMFYGYMSTTYSVNRDIVHQLYLAANKGDTASQRAFNFAKDAPKVAGQLMAFWVAYSVLGELLTGRGPEDDDGDDEVSKWANWFVRKLLMAPLNSLPFIGAPVEKFVLGKKPSIRSHPGFALMEKIGTSALKALDGDSEAGEIAIELLKTLGFVFGAPTPKPLSAGQSIGLLPGGQN